MRPQKTCPYCHEHFAPYPALYRRQRACGRLECQKQRKRDTNRIYREKNPHDADYRREIKKRWREKHGCGYMRRYRKEHPGYVKANCRQQKRRDREKANLVKKDVWGSLHSGKLVRIRVLEESCKERLMRLLPE